IAVILGCALIVSAVVVYALVRMTAPSGDDSEASPTRSAASTDTQLVSSPTTVASVVSGSPTAASTGERSSSVPPATGATGATAPSPSSGEPSTAPSTTHSDLAGSGVTIPAAWSGTAKVTVTVRGECATGNPS